MKTYVIALTTYREIVRRPLFWGLIGVTSLVLTLFVFLPYYTLGEDIKMLKDQGLATIMLTGLVVALFSASVSISDEIEGKTALTLLSKPITRRDFIVGKFLGIMAAIALLFLILTIVFGGWLFYKARYDAREYAADYPKFSERMDHIFSVLPGVVLSYFIVAVLCSLSVALSTRLPLHLNLTGCIAVFAIGHLAPRMVQASNQGQFEGVKFMANFFSTVFPNLERFNVYAAISTSASVPWGEYVLPCFFQSVLYCSVMLMLALLMFEDRDLA